MAVIAALCATPLGLGSHAQARFIPKGFAAAPGCTATVKAKAAVKPGASKRVIGRASYGVAAGKSALVHFKLTATARKALKQRKRLQATVTITTAHGGRTTKRTEKVTLKA